MAIGEMTPDEVPAVLAMVRALWPDAGDYDFGYTELASDVELDNAGSLAAHAKLGFEPTLRVQFFRKSLR